MITPARSAETDWQRLILDCKVLLITSKSLKRLPGGWIQCLRALIANWSVFERPPHRVRRNFGAFASDGLPSNPTPLRHGSANIAVSYTHLRAHETRHDLVCRLLLE